MSEGFRCCFVHTIEVNGLQCCSVPKVHIFCVLHEKESRTGLEGREGESLMNDGVNYSFNRVSTCSQLNQTALAGKTIIKSLICGFSFKHSLQALKPLKRR